MPCYCEPDYFANKLPEFLCSACRLLSKEQMDSIPPNSDYTKSLLWWYKRHLRNDYRYNTGEEREAAIKEAARLGFDLRRE